MPFVPPPLPRRDGTDRWRRKQYNAEDKNTYFQQNILTIMRRWLDAAHLAQLFVYITPVFSRLELKLDVMVRTASEVLLDEIFVLICLVFNKISDY
jgi:hypothetical protein